MTMAKLSDKDREALIAYLDGELDEEAARRVETRLNLDPNTRLEAESLKRAWNMLDYLPRAEPSSTFTHRTLERVALQTGKLPWYGRKPWAALGWAAAVLAAAAIGFAASRLGGPASPGPPLDPPDLEEQMAKHFGVIQRIRAYENVDDVEFLRALAQPDLFGDEP
jgi:anti-sigma factor RsiW